MSASCAACLVGYAFSNKFQVYLTAVRDSIVICSEARIGMIKIYNRVGKLVVQQHMNGKTVVLSLADLAPGVYFVRADRHRAAVKVVKE
ncbi:T9SS type A sorting domain-containing protein [Pontibacter liquoris]|uniref:T9SS type A sorting domain-containing protein n=1 Tax=Pontibacter liquoris TaxID=2905677 RepID=UPI0021039FDA|nr:T9SS type A sorting domain-containing protein [Pontibacter liquoris]